MKDFAAIDFETANNQRSSVCSVGIVVVRNDEIVDTFYSLINPEPNYYSYWCSQVHGLTREDTENAPVFPDVWKQIDPLIDGLPLVAHNRPFDESCLKAVFRVYQMDYPDYEFYDTLCVSRKSVSIPSQPSVAHRSRRLRIPSRKPPSRTGRCRGLCVDSKRNIMIPMQILLAIDTFKGCLSSEESGSRLLAGPDRPRGKSPFPPHVRRRRRDASGLYHRPSRAIA